MLLLGCQFEKQIEFEVLQDIPKGTRFFLVPIERTYGKKPKVRIGFEMPPSIAITREGAICKEPSEKRSEVRERIEREKEVKQ